MPKKKDFSPHISPDKAPPCHVDGCLEAGVYKAPRSRSELHDYQWFCLQHIREHNEKWDYFAGMEQPDIERFMKDAVTGHRPTWEREALLKDYPRKLQDAIYAFLNGKPKPEKPVPQLNGKLRKSLRLFELPYPYSKQELKEQYRVLVKKHHPDLNKGDKESEEAFKQVAVAYQVLLEHIKNLD